MRHYCHTKNISCIKYDFSSKTFSPDGKTLFCRTSKNASPPPKGI
jgi:hypothetical protein